MLDEYRLEILRYLPRDIYMGESLDYLSYHSQIIQVNGKSKLHLIEYFALHILWMAFLQKVTFDLFKADPIGVKLAFSSEGNIIRALEDARVSYDLSMVNEKKLCEICKHTDIDFRLNKISNMRALVDKRDHIAHCSGVLDLDDEEISSLARQCLRYTKEIFEKVNSRSLQNWKKFIEESPQKEAQYTLIHDAVVEHVALQNYSVADIEYILNSAGEGSSSFEKTSLFHLSLYLEDYDIETEIKPEDYKSRALASAADDDERAKIQDEHEAYINFRLGLAKA